MVIHKIRGKRGGYDWRIKKLEELPEKFSTNDAFKVGLKVGDLQALRHRGCINHIRIDQSGVYGCWTKYKFCIPKELRDKSRK